MHPMAIWKQCEEGRFHSFADGLAGRDKGDRMIDNRCRTGCHTGEWFVAEMWVWVWMLGLDGELGCGWTCVCDNGMKVKGRGRVR